MEARPVINLQETIGKVVGRRVPGKPSADIQKTLNEIFTSQGHKLWPRGIYRFKTHEEADAWKWKMIRPKKVS